MLLLRPMPNKCQESLKGWLERLINAYVLRNNTATHTDINQMNEVRLSGKTTTTHQLPNS